MFGDVRRHFGIQGKKRKRPRHPAVYVERGDVVRAEEIPLEAHPALLPMPIFSPPGILFNAAKTNDLPFVLQLINFVPDLDQRLAALGGAVRTRPFLIEPFGRMLCKIAHAFAYAEGRGEFDPYLNPIIRGVRPLYLSHYVGSSIINEPPGNATNTLHQIWMEFHNPYVIIRIRLFAIVEAPVYWVVVGMLRET
jgi:hypothetical protein